MGLGRATQFPPLMPLPMCLQNLVLPDTFFSFFDLRREFHVQHPSTCPARELTVATMAQGTCDPEGLGRGEAVFDCVHPEGLHTRVYIICKVLDETCLRVGAGVCLK